MSTTDPRKSKHMREISNIPLDHNDLSTLSDCKTIDKLLVEESKIKHQEDIDMISFTVDQRKSDLIQQESSYNGSL